MGTDADDSLSVGRILIRGPHLMLKYWNQASALDNKDQLWFDTGDIGFIVNHGELWLIGREKGRIKSGGENVYPEEVSEETSLCSFAFHFELDLYMPASSFVVHIRGYGH